MQTSRWDKFHGIGISAREGGHAAERSENGDAATAEADVPAVAEIIVRSSPLRPDSRLLSSPPTDVLRQIWLYLRVACPCSAPVFGAPQKRHIKYLTPFTSTILKL